MEAVSSISGDSGTNARDPFGRGSRRSKTRAHSC
jgi:hypothetical protein